MARSRFTKELPQAVPARALHELVATGVTQGTVRGAGWRRVHQGFYVAVGAP